MITREGTPEAAVVVEAMEVSTGAGAGPEHSTLATDILLSQKAQISVDDLTTLVTLEKRERGVDHQAAVCRAGGQGRRADN